MIKKRVEGENMTISTLENIEHTEQVYLAHTGLLNFPRKFGTPDQFIVNNGVRVQKQDILSFSNFNSLIVCL